MSSAVKPIPIAPIVIQNGEVPQAFEELDEVCKAHAVFNKNLSELSVRLTRMEHLCQEMLAEYDLSPESTSSDEELFPLLSDFEADDDALEIQALSLHKSTIDLKICMFKVEQSVLDLLSGNKEIASESILLASRTSQISAAQIQI